MIAACAADIESHERSATRVRIGENNLWDGEERWSARRLLYDRERHRSDRSRAAAGVRRFDAHGIVPGHVRHPERNPNLQFVGCRGIRLKFEYLSSDRHEIDKCRSRSREIRAGKGDECFLAFPKQMLARARLRGFVPARIRRRTRIIQERPISALPATQMIASSRRSYRRLRALDTN